MPMTVRPRCALNCNPPHIIGLGNIILPRIRESRTTVKKKPRIVTQFVKEVCPFLKPSLPYHSTFLTRQQTKCVVNGNVIREHIIFREVIAAGKNRDTKLCIIMEHIANDLIVARTILKHDATAIAKELVIFDRISLGPSRNENAASRQFSEWKGQGSVIVIISSVALESVV